VPFKALEGLKDFKDWMHKTTHDDLVAVQLTAAPRNAADDNEEQRTADQTELGDLHLSTGDDSALPTTTASTTKKKKRKAKKPRAVQVIFFNAEKRPL